MPKSVCRDGSIVTDLSFGADNPQSNFELEERLRTALTDDDFPYAVDPSSITYQRPRKFIIL